MFMALGKIYLLENAYRILSILMTRSSSRDEIANLNYL